jgi:hypothetical protein
MYRQARKGLPKGAFQGVGWPLGEKEGGAPARQNVQAIPNSGLWIVRSARLSPADLASMVGFAGLRPNPLTRTRSPKALSAFRAVAISSTTTNRVRERAAP